MRSWRLFAALAVVVAGCGVDLGGLLGANAASLVDAAAGDATTTPGSGEGGGDVDDPTDAGVSVDAVADVPLDAGGAASASLAVTADPSGVDLTEAGAVDWAHWGDEPDGSPVRKANGGSVIGAFSVAGAACHDNFGPAWPVNATWSNGAPIASSGPTNIHRRFYGSTGLAVSIAVPCDGASHVLSVDVGGWSSEARFEVDFDTVHPAPAIQDLRGNTGGYYSARYAVTYVCPLATHLVVRWVATNLPASTQCTGSDLILSSATLR